ncbi:MAG TPA: hypothetical protein VMX15_06390 [Candidatus Heimdallarchaeota archaeon]|nr:hypothetical protein [Candidatus Heimdallarchaeota archaeon]
MTLLNAKPLDCHGNERLPIRDLVLMESGAAMERPVAERIIAWRIEQNEARIRELELLIMSPEEVPQDLEGLAALYFFAEEEDGKQELLDALESEREAHNA